ncbi:uncharacterized protein C9orf57 homolog [Sorex fumeus]|uniref:uncharacterized protein C9orf57 homolog n=1 Tax=Sorex fumeus TaxID=62283 RepID=UPI0024AD02A9|nr:uncharacterized protein C9orf57 homolog [Sorex fumeus]
MSDKPPSDTDAIALETRTDVGSLLCRFCNLSLAFHGCLLDFGTCNAGPEQFCIEERYYKDGIYWYSIKGCTESGDECFKTRETPFKTQITHCCSYPLCNL